MAEYIELERCIKICTDYCAECLANVAIFDGLLPDCSECLFHEFKKSFAKIPVADVQPVKHGVWETDEDGCACCSICGNPAEINPLSGECILSLYCSECGAKMDYE